MEFNKLKTELKSAQLDTLRIDNDDYFEAVIKSSHLNGIIHILEGVFGPPAQPSRNKLSKEIENLIKDAGGLRRGQTLYFLNKEGRSIFAMLWPWRDGEKITIKIVKKG